MTDPTFQTAPDQTSAQPWRTLLSFPAAFGPSFWIAFMLHALVAELWLRPRPLPPEITSDSMTIDWARTDLAIGHSDS